MCKEIQRKLEEEKVVKLSAVFHVVTDGCVEGEEYQPFVGRN